MLTNDISEVVKKKLSVLMHGGESSDTTRQPLTEPEVVSASESPDNPLISGGFSPGRLIFGAIIGFWFMVIAQFWWMPIAMAGLTFFLLGPDVLSEAYATVTTGQLLLSALTWAIPATMLAVITYWRVAAKLAKGMAIERKIILLWQLPSLCFAGLVFYDISHIILKFFL